MRSEEYVPYLNVQKKFNINYKTNKVFAWKYRGSKVETKLTFRVSSSFSIMVLFHPQKNKENVKISVLRIMSNW